MRELLRLRLLAAIIGALLVFFVTTLATPASAEGLAGWKHAVWGMTETQLLQAFPGQLRRLERPRGMPARGAAPWLEIASYPLGHEDGRVRFLFSPAGHLVEVRLTASPTSGAYAEATFSTLRSALRTRYGKPSADTGIVLRQGWGRVVQARATWRLGWTVVALQLWCIGDEVATVSLSHAAVDTHSRPYPGGAAIGPLAGAPVLAYR
jgi:hypothetical protein